MNNYQNKIIFLTLIFLSSCVNGIITGTDESARFKISPLNQGQVDFTVVKNLILTPFCVQCHTWANAEEKVLQRVVAGNPAASNLYLQVESGRMPQGLPRLSTNLLLVLQKYIEGIASIPPPLPITATYTSLKANLLEKSCLSCHNTLEATRRRIPDFESKTQVITSADDILYTMTTGRELDDIPMPPTNSNAPIPTLEIINAFKNWIAAGFPD